MASVSISTAACGAPLRPSQNRLIISSDASSTSVSPVLTPQWDTPGGKALGDRVVAFVQANAQELGLDHAIWRQTMHNADGSSSGMEDRGDPNQNHFNHVHIASIGGGYNGY